MEAVQNSKSLPPKYVKRRIEQAENAVEANELDALIVTNPANKGYLSGFTNGVHIAFGGNLIITRSDLSNIYVTSGVDHTDCSSTVKPLGFEVIAYDYDKGQTAGTETVRALAEMNVDTAAVEKKSVTVDQFEKLKSSLKDNDVQLKALPDLITPLRQVKDPWEIDQIKQASRISEKAFEDILQMIAPGVTEWELASELEYRLRKNGVGSSRIAFQSIVASGPNSALPHASVTDRKLQKGDLLTFDFGATCNGYCADITRTVCIGEADDKQRDVYHAVLDAQKTVIDNIEPGGSRTACAQEGVTLMKERGYGEYLAHGSGGHGIGLEVHEGPNTSEEGTWQPGNIVTVEPGIYIPDWGGVRIEDDVLIKEEGIEIITDLDKQLLQL